MERLNVNKVEVNGARFTGSRLFEQAFQQLLSGESMDLPQIVKASVAATKYLQKFDVLSEVSVCLSDANASIDLTHNNPLLLLQSAMAGRVDPSQFVSIDRPLKAVDVMFNVKEKNRFYLRTGTEFGANEGSLLASLLCRNIFGNGEKLEGNLSRGTRTTVAYELKLTVPLIDRSYDRYSNVQASLFSRDEDWTESSSYSVSHRGFSLCTSLLWPNTSHNLSFSVARRKYFNLPLNASLYTRENAKAHLKDCLRYQFAFSNADNESLPSTGSLLDISLELAGLFTDAKYLKCDLQSRRAYQILDKITLLSTWRSGIIHSLGGGVVPLCDLFHLGGPLSLRGFQTRGAGPMSDCQLRPFKVDSTGGKLFFEAGYSLFTPVPFLTRYENLKLHFFTNTGLLSQSDPLSMFSSESTFPLQRISVGCGLCFKASNCRLELNVTKPLKSETADRLAPTIQLGIGIDFL